MSPRATFSPAQLRLALLLAFVLTVATIAIWRHNRDILRDLFDYSTVINAAGKIEAGFKPYKDVRSPMQTSVYYLNWLTERVFGATYLGLTWGGLVQALGGGLMVAWLVARRWGALAGVLLAAAVVLAGLIQHMVFFYNPIGILCLTIVLLGVAGRPALWPLNSADGWLVIAALMLGGTNKVNFQLLTLALASALIGQAWLNGRLSGKAMLASGMVLLSAGILVPLGFELWWTGATLQEWLNNVVFRSAARASLTWEVFGWHTFLQPPRDFHHHILIRAQGGFGLLLLLLTGWWSLRFWGPERLRTQAQVGRLAYLLAAVAGSTLLMLSNNESVLLTSLSFLVCAVALFLACRTEAAVDRWVGRVLLFGAGVWAVAGGYAAWHGSRIHYGPNPPPRKIYQRLTGAPKPLAYFEGVRFENYKLVAMQGLAERLTAMEDLRGHLHGVLFGPAMEWLERAYPEAIVRHMPIWYDAETGLSEDDGPWFQRTLDENGINCLVTHPSWEAWPETINLWLQRDFRLKRFSNDFCLYHRRRPVPAPGIVALPPAWMFRDWTGSNLLLATTHPGAGMELLPRNDVHFLGANTASRWDWQLPAKIVEGKAIMVAPPGSGAIGTFRVFAVVADDERLLWQANLTPAKGEMRFRVDARGQRLRLTTEIGGSASDQVQAGWTGLRLNETPQGDATSMGLPFLSGLTAVKPPAGQIAPEGLAFVQRGVLVTDVESLPVPFEQWRWITGGPTRVKVTVAVSPAPTDTGIPVMVGLIWFRSGRFELLAERGIQSRQKSVVSIESVLPEGGDAWVGVWVRRPGPDGGGEFGRIISWETH